ncbi:ABC transporter substrate-binding protein [Streptomyces scabiei]|uniref:ABC transporter substrate-binding protein n=1 Tax=Streptomyces scabiei TaxID=1930 RepID=UPI002990772F|nr:ABC transporter substrate-binding protein [Streptomyces scabiei]MDW8803606.1 ABC transporter substrate-binding protein [Streptomyces scabiei]
MRRTTRSAFAATTTMTLAGLAALSGCTDAGTATGTASGTGKSTLTLGMSQDIQGWDPTAQPSYQGWASSAVYDTILRCDGRGKPHEAVAASWSVDKGNTGITVQVRPGMKFSDGTPVNAAAVKASIEYGGKKGGGAARYAGWKVSTPDDMTAVIKLDKPDPLIVQRTCDMRVSSPDYLASGDTNKAPGGSGPYTLDASATTRGSVYTFKKNEAFWDSKAYPYKKLVIKVIPNETAAINALKTGQIDGSLITQATYSQAKAAGLKIQSQESLVARLLLTDHQGKKIPALGNRDVRRAMNMVFDKEAMAKNLYRGLAKPTAQIFRSSSSAYIKDLKDPYTYDVEAAKALMKKAGYEKGFTLEIPYLQGQNLDSLMPVVKQQLGLLNIKVKQVNLSGADAIANLLSGTYPVPMWLLGNYGNSLQDITDYVLPNGIWNVMHQDDPKVDALWKKILTDTPQQSVKDQQAVNRYIVDEAWFVPMVSTGMYYAHSPKIDIPQSTDPSGLHPMLVDFK